jgi:hypothetical protein
MSIETLALVLHHSRATGVDKLVALGIANHDGDGGAWPTVKTLAKYANASERTVQRSIVKLVDLGELIVHLNAGGLGDLQKWERPNRYDVTVECPSTCDRSKNHREIKLPAAPACLWTDPVTPPTPGDTPVTREATHTSPDQVTQVSPKPSLEPDGAKGSGSVTGPRATCSVCGLDAHTCIRRAKTSGHDYTPTHRDAAEVIARVHRIYS